MSDRRSRLLQIPVFSLLIVAALICPIGAGAKAAQGRACVPSAVISERPQAEGQSALTIFALCGGKAIDLGFANRYETSANSAAAALVVARWIDDVATIQLIFGGPDGAMHVDDLSREIALRLDRPEAQDLSGVTVSFTDFPTDGTFAIRTGSSYGASTAGTVIQTKPTQFNQSQSLDVRTVSFSLAPYLVAASAAMASTDTRPQSTEQ